jgi:hypothetical protein
MQVEVERVLEGRAVRIRVSLDVSLDDDSVVLLAQTVNGLQRLAFPPPGAHAMFAPAMPPVAFMDAF